MECIHAGMAATFRFAVTGATADRTPTNQQFAEVALSAHHSIAIRIAEQVADDHEFQPEGSLMCVLPKRSGRFTRRGLPHRWRRLCLPPSNGEPIRRLARSLFRSVRSLSASAAG